MPAMFLTYLFFWIFVKSSKEKRAILIVIYLCINVATNYLPILLPWSLDTVFVTSIVMYLGHCSKEKVKCIEELDIKSIFKPKIFVGLMCTMLIYCIAVKVNGAINTSVRIFGNYKILSVLLYIIIGCIGTLAYMTVFAVCENTHFLKGIANCFEYLGHCTIEILSVHIMVFDIVEKMFGYFNFENKYLIYSCKIIFGTIFGIVLNIMVKKVIKYLRAKRVDMNVPIK